jgi:hydroxypyruvate reductase
MRLIQPARTVNLIMQVGLFPRWGGSLPPEGSWVPCWPPAPRRMAQAVQALKEKPWWTEFTPALREMLEREDPRYEVPDRAEWAGLRASYWQPIDLYQMVEGARAKAEALGLKGVILSSHLATLSASAASVLSQIAYECERYNRPFSPPVALITGGHLDVPVAEATGVGGRNQEFVLLWGQALANGSLASKRVVVAGLDSDGTEGTGATNEQGEMVCMAGGIADGYLLELAVEAGVDVAAELKNHNSMFALMKLNSAIYTGNTGMALGDLRVALVR